MESKKFIFLCGIILFIVGCNSGCTSGNCRSQQIKQEQIEGPTPVKENKLIPPPSVSERVKVYKLDGSLQCAQGKRIELVDMQKELKDIKVYKSFSENDGMMRIQMCGAPTGNANVYEIDRENLKSALALGFKEWLNN